MDCLFGLLECACVCSVVCRRPDVDSGGGAGEVLSSVETVRGFAETLVPLLLEVWVETVGSENGRLLSGDAMVLMHQILLILQLLRRLTPQHHLQEELVSAPLWEFVIHGVIRRCYLRN